MEIMIQVTARDSEEGPASKFDTVDLIIELTDVNDDRPTLTTDQTENVSRFCV